MSELPQVGHWAQGHSHPTVGEAPFSEGPRFQQIPQGRAGVCLSGVTRGPLALPSQKSWPHQPAQCPATDTRPVWGPRRCLGGGGKHRRSPDDPPHQEGPLPCILQASPKPTLLGPRAPAQSLPTQPSKDQHCLHTGPCKAVRSPPKKNENLSPCQHRLGPRESPTPGSHIIKPLQRRSCSRGAPDPPGYPPTALLLARCQCLCCTPVEAPLTPTHKRSAERRPGPGFRSRQPCTWDVGQPQVSPKT